MMQVETFDQRVEFLRAFQKHPTVGPSVYHCGAEQQMRIGDA